MCGSSAGQLTIKIYYSSVPLYYQRNIKTQSKHCQKAKQKALNVDTLRLLLLYYLVSLFDLIISIKPQYFLTIDISTFLYLVIFQ